MFWIENRLINGEIEMKIILPLLMMLSASSYASQVCTFSTIHPVVPSWQWTCDSGIDESKTPTNSTISNSRALAEFTQALTLQGFILQESRNTIGIEQEFKFVKP